MTASQTSYTCTGRCKCGALRYRLDGQPLFTHACHCLNCQRNTGTAFSMTTIVLTADLTITEGEVAATKPSPRSTALSCANCGTLIYTASTAFPVTVIVKSGTFDDPNVVTPGAHIWVKRKQPWVILPEDVPQFEEAYDRDEVWPAESLARFRVAGG